MVVQATPEKEGRMKITISVAMMAHPRRAEQVEQILSEIDRRDVDVVWDQCSSRWDTGKRAMLAYDQSCSHHAVIQDDVLVCRDLFAGLAKALAHVPGDVPICGYVGRVRPYAELVTKASATAQKIGASWLTMHCLNWGPLIVVPTAAIPEMIAYSDRLVDIANYDRRLSRYWELSARRPIWYTWPSVVDHRDGPSLVPGRTGTDCGHKHPSRIAHTFLGCDKSALDIDWSGRVVDAEASVSRYSGPGLMRFRNTKTGQELLLPPFSPRVCRLKGLPSWALVPQED